MQVLEILINAMDLLGIANGLLFGIWLIAINKNKKRTLFLGLFLITFSISLLNSWISAYVDVDEFPSLEFLPLDFEYLTLPLLYVYCKVLVDRKWSMSLLIHLIPGVIEFSVLTVLFLSSRSFQMNLLTNASWDYFRNISFVLSIVYSLFYIGFAFKIIRQYSNSNQLSTQGAYHLKWLEILMFSVAVFGMFLIISTLTMDYGLVLGTLESVINLILIFGIGISAIRQPAEIIDFTERKEGPDEGEMDRKLFALIEDQLEHQKLYTRTDLNIKKMAEVLSTNPRTLSKVINEKTGQNFNRFINKYRVEEAKRLLEDAKYDHLNMLGVADAAGFSSKANFFSVFKQIVSISPGAYKKLKRNLS